MLPLTRTLICSLALVAPALASDGVLEINQTCALSSAGCFPGDVGGSFPVTITQASTSYRLTSSLQVSSANTTAIEVTGFDVRVSIDLNGFTIRGITACSAGGGNPAVCSPRGTGRGIAATNLNVRVRNGFIAGMGSHGLDIGSGSVENLVVFSNGGDGVRGGEAVSLHAVQAMWNHENGINITLSGVVTACTANGNGMAGIAVTRGNVVDSLSERNGTYGVGLGVHAAARSNVLAENDQGSLAGGQATGGNYCDDGRCSRTGARRYFLSQTPADGGFAPFICSNAGRFHMASLFELLDPSHLVYDTALGVTFANSGSGPPSDTTGAPGPADGWIRDGLAASTASNCNAWTSGSGSHNGSMAALLRNGVFGASDAGSGLDASTWGVRGAACNVPQNVWCIED